MSELTKHVSKCKKCDKRFAKKVVELEIKLVLDFHIYGSSCLEVFCRKDVQEILQNSQENTCARGNFSINLQERIKNALRKNLSHRRFFMNFARFLRTPFFYRTPPVATSVIKRTLFILVQYQNVL